MKSSLHFEKRGAGCFFVCRMGKRIGGGLGLHAAFHVCCCVCANHAFGGWLVGRFIKSSLHFKFGVQAAFLRFARPFTA